MNRETKTSFFDFIEHPIIADRYEFVRIVGKGAMGVVIKVNDKMLDDDTVALKLLYPYLIADQTILARFKNEVLVARKLAHPNIVRLYDFGWDQPTSAFISMEYVEGSSLASLIHPPKGIILSFPDICHILRATAAGLQHAHSEGVVHRDIKPDNVIITEKKVVKLTDLGLARSLDVDKGYTGTGEAVGTPFYIAPETIYGFPPDPRADIYSFGIMAYEMATGRLPFSDKSWLRLAEMHLKHPLPDLIGEARNHPSWFKELLIAATHKEAKDRFQSFEELIGYIDNNLNKVTTPPPVVEQPKLRWRRQVTMHNITVGIKKSRFFILTVVMITALIIGIIYGIRSSHNVQ
ncbi:MAG: serine/threonine protein kinase [Deltaproteobacteria bacterium]|nr:serine/threonine protein kinase [Deltaproteobacteria bacterium]